MINVTDEVVNLFIGVWAETWRGRIDGNQPSIKDQRERAQNRNLNERPNLPVSEWIDVYKAGYGYEDQSLVVPYGGPRPYLGFRPKDDPDPRLFLFLTVELAVCRLKPYQTALADHYWILRRPDKVFRYKAANNEVNPVPVGRALEDWCKKTRARTIRPKIHRAIETYAPETIVESTLLDIQEAC